MAEFAHVENELVSAEDRLRETELLLSKKEAALRERDRTVQELTARLSQTVERLDRVQRVGSDRAVISTSAFPKEVVEQQTELVNDLQRAVKLWEEMQVSCGMERFEGQLAELQSLFDEHFREEETPPTNEEGQQESDLEFSDAEPDTDSESSGEEGESDSLEKSPGDQQAFQETLDEVPMEDDFVPLRPPEILNLNDCDISALRHCVEQQDTYIDYLSARLQRAAAKKTAVNWEDLAKSPQKIEGQLLHTAKKIQQSRHFAEFELALQRTRLKRQERELAKLSQELATQMQTVTPNLAVEEDDDGTPGGRRWMRMLGMGKNEAE